MPTETELNTPERFTGRAVARTGLLGNPSDGYGGRVLAMTLPGLEAEVTVEPASDWNFGPTELLAATVEALRRQRPELVAEPALLSFTTTIPRQVGLSGSSAIVMAALRAFAARARHRWDPVELARMTLDVETEVLGWAAGPQDRVVQAFGGLLDMDFATPWNRHGYHRLDPSTLPPLFVAWRRTHGTASTVTHSDVRQRWLDGDVEVRDTMRRFARLASRGRASLDAQTAADDWPGLLDEAFELRAKIWTITTIDAALVGAGQSIGAGVAFAGSGGAVVGALPSCDQLETAAAAYAELDAGFMVIHR